MKIINKSKNATLAESYIEPKSLIDQSLGLIKYKTPKAMLLKTRYGIHTLFMKYPIDILILNNKNHVVSIKENMQPNEYFVWNIKYTTVLELPAGTINRTFTQIDDYIEME